MNIVLIDEHVEAFSVWQENVSRKKSNVLLHVDSHDDMGFASQLDESLYDVKDFRKFAERNLNIASFIVPAAILGCFSEVYDLRPANEPDPNKAKVVKLENERKKKKRQKKVFKHEYYSWNDEGKIWYRSLVRRGRDLAGATKKHTLFYHPIYSLMKVPQGLEIILDIDMDYFSCNHFVDYQYKPRLTQRQIKEAKQFSVSDDAYKINLGLVNIDKDGRLVEASAYCNNKKYEKIYNDDPLWIDFAIREFVAGIKNRFKIKFISIARSIKTGYTPKKHGQLIEQALKENLRSKNPIDTRPPYKANFVVQEDISYSPGNRHVVNKRTLEEYHLSNKADVAMWNMLQSGACFGDIVEHLMKDFKLSRKESEKELIANIWYLKKDGVLR